MTQRRPARTPAPPISAKALHAGPKSASRMKITPELLSWAKQKPVTGNVEQLFERAKPAPGVLPEGDKVLAMDEAFDAALGSTASWASEAFGAAFAEGQMFPGYPYLAMLQLRAEYRRMNETLAYHMTRKWITLKAVDDNAEGDRTDRIQELNTELDRLRVRECFKEAAEQDGAFGRSHLYLDLGTTDNPAELSTTIGDGSDAQREQSQAKVGKGSLLRIKPVEAVWCYPSNYNASDPLKPDWYRPQLWFVMGKEVHASRLLTFVGREVPDLLKPAYNFGGLSLSQMAKPYVDNWLRTRQSVSDLIQAFSIVGLGTNMSANMQPGGDDELRKRLQLFNDLRNNRGVFAYNKADEALDILTVSLAGLSDLQAQSQEHMAAVSGIPLVFLLGISPKGLNASSEGEIRAFYDWIHSYQEAFFKPNLKRVIAFAMLNIWGEVDEGITFEFNKLHEMTKKEQAELEKSDADRDSQYITAGVLSADDVRRRLSSDPENPYHGIATNDPDDAATGEEAIYAQLSDFLQGKLSDEDMAQLQAMFGAQPDEEDDEHGATGADPSDNPTLEQRKSAVTGTAKVAEH